MKSPMNIFSGIRAWSRSVNNPNLFSTSEMWSNDWFASRLFSSPDVYSRVQHNCFCSWHWSTIRYKSWNWRM